MFFLKMCEDRVFHFFYFKKNGGFCNCSIFLNGAL